MRSHPRISRLLAVGAVAAVVFAAINALHTLGPIHLHEDGPLGPLSGAGFAFDSAATGPWTVGYSMCLEHGTDPAVIESVSPASVVGGGLKYIGAFVREINGEAANTNNSGPIGTDAFPPKDQVGILKPVAGFPVTLQCGPNGVPSSFTELDVGIGRFAHSGAGGWTGYTVDYRVGSTQYVVTWGTGIYACDPSAPPSAPCVPPASWAAEP